MKEIKNCQFQKERDLYNQSNIKLINCLFDGQEDGESHLKECNDIELVDTIMALRYPLWHCHKIIMNNVTMKDTCRASLWYSTDIVINDSHLNGIKAVRECQNINFKDSYIIFNEFGWKCKNIDGKNTTINGEYLFLESENINLDNVVIKGKYNFQYVKNVTIDNSVIESKDFFWHGENVTIKNSVINGEYLAWYSKNLTLINCRISGTQPFCYCQNLTMINCVMEDTDLSFEYSILNVEVNSHIDSIKNPISGIIKAKSIGEIILTEDSKYECKAKIEVEE